ncbi:hypothetical protein DFH09DRAFT_1369739 [Mycena vulgaris]|nr:hypothetical protein DFH09DRAFT_1369739 [Mycena vulgaris]
MNSSLRLASYHRLARISPTRSRTRPPCPPNLLADVIAAVKAYYAISPAYYVVPLPDSTWKMFAPTPAEGKLTLDYDIQRQLYTTLHHPSWRAAREARRLKPLTIFPGAFRVPLLNPIRPTLSPHTHQLPTPPPNHATPILIYGAGSMAGQYAVQLLHAAGYTNVVATAFPKHHAFLRALGATRVVDYASPTLAADITAGGPQIALALDAITAEGTIVKIAQVLSPQGTVAFLLSIKEGDAVAVGEAAMHSTIPEGRNPFAPETRIAYVQTFNYRENEYLKDNLMPRTLPQLLAAGLIQPNRVRLLDQGTFKERVATGLDLLRNNKRLGTARLSLRLLLAAKADPKPGPVLAFVKATGRFPRYSL